jgi:hypothetical protein
MEKFTMEDLKRLAQIEGECCISFYLPTQPTAATTDGQRIRFKNMLRLAEKRIQEHAPKNKALSAMIAEGQRLEADTYFWRTQRQGMAVFIAPDLFQHYRLPERFDETFQISRRLHIKPLLPMFMALGRFFILALSQHEIRLFSCNRHNAVEVELTEVTQGIEATLQYDSKERQLQHHIGAADTTGGPGNRQAMFHGHGVSIDDQKDEILLYFQRADKGLRAVLADQRAPLILAGVDYLLPLFRKASSYRNIFEGTLTGNPEGVRGEELHAKALEIILPHLEKEQEQMKLRYQEMAGKGYTTAGARNVVRAAAYGKVEELFVALDERQPGTFDQQKNEVIMNPDDPLADDLLDLAAALTIQNSGRVHAMKKEGLPDQNAAAAAILRY